MFYQYRLFELCNRVSIFAENKPEYDSYHLQRLDGDKKTAKKQYEENEKKNKKKKQNKRYLVAGIFQDEMPTRRRAYTKLSTR